MVLEQKRADFILLSLDTTTEMLTMALSVSGQLLSQEALRHERRLASLFPQCLEDFLKKQNRTYRDLDGICLNSGPGSFTGIRIGMAAALGIGLTLSIPVFGVTGFQSAYISSMESSFKDRAVILLPDTIEGAYYRQSLNGSLTPQGPYEKADYIDEASFLKENVSLLDPSLIWVVPENLHTLALEKKHPGSKLKTVPLCSSFSSASSIAHAGWKLIELGSSLDLVPLYVKPCYADDLMKKRDE